MTEDPRVVALREQAHIDRRAPHTVTEQMYKAAIKGRRAPHILRVGGPA